MERKVTGKILLVDDNKYEEHLLNEALEANNWDIYVVYFSNVKDALEYLRENIGGIFLIISDMNMPEMNGMDFKKVIDNDEYVGQKSIPFIFVSSEATNEQIKEAYYYRVQGFFKKPDSIEGQAELLKEIIEYWMSCVFPKKGDVVDESKSERF